MVTFRAAGSPIQTKFWKAGIVDDSSTQCAIQTGFRHRRCERIESVRVLYVTSSIQLIGGACSILSHAVPQRLWIVSRRCAGSLLTSSMMFAQNRALSPVARSYLVTACCRTKHFWCVQGGESDGLLRWMMIDERATRGDQCVCADAETAGDVIGRCSSSPSTIRCDWADQEPVGHR